MTVHLAVLGDSIAYGQGAARPADTVGARLVARLTAGGQPAELHMFAVPGARSDALAAQVRRAAAAVRADVALIIVGANDLTHFVPADHAAAQLEAAVRALRSGGAEVVVAPAPDLGVLPWLPPQFRVAVSAGSATLRQAQTRAALAAGARVADVEGTTSTRFSREPALFSADRFHPSSAGYALIADAVAPAVLAAVASATARDSGRDDCTG
jgi:lysophospholipase L1-like esterase